MQIVNQKFSFVANKLIDIRQSLVQFARDAGRNPDDIRLIAISKTHPSEAIAAAIAAGQLDFGENTTQEALEKIPHFKDKPVTWHFIGHLQSNKARFIPGNFSWLHSLDSLPLAQKLSRFAQDQSATINILIEVNVTRDPKKHGVTPEALLDFVEKLLTVNLPALSLRGLMTIGPHGAPEKEIRRCFASLRELRDACQTRFALPQFTELSMGMSGDYAEAIKEGATMIRVGTAIFGDRDYPEK
jgi:hypothetical protein